MPRWPSDVDVAPSSLAALIREHRVASGLSQNQLARLAGVDPAYVNRMEAERTTNETGRQHGPSRRVVLGLAEALDLRCSEADRLLFAAGLAPQTDWQTRAVRAEVALATIRQAFDDHAQVDAGEQPTFIRSHVG